jgi:hypothetical protein
MKRTRENRRTSLIWKIETEDLIRLVNESSSIVEILKKLGFDAYNGNHKTLKHRLKEDNICTEEMKKRGKEERRTWAGKFTKIDDREVFCEDSNYSRSSLKKRIIKEKILPYECSGEDCDITDKWHGEKISLQLDHINGVNNDHRLSNIRFLCPNCHSQTNTFSGKRLKREMVQCIICIVEKAEGGRRATMCNLCRDKRMIEVKNGQKKFNPSNEELTKTIRDLKYNIRKVGEFYNVSDTAIRKRCKKLEINYKKKNTNI